MDALLRPLKDHIGREGDRYYPFGGEARSKTVPFNETRGGSKKFQPAGFHKVDLLAELGDFLVMGNND